MDETEFSQESSDNFLSSLLLTSELHVALCSSAAHERCLFWMRLDPWGTWRRWCVDYGVLCTLKSFVFSFFLVVPASFEPHVSVSLSLTKPQTHKNGSFKLTQLNGKEREKVCVCYISLCVCVCCVRASVHPPIHTHRAPIGDTQHRKLVNLYFYLHCCFAF